MRWPTALWYATSHAADLAMIEGDLTRAETLAREAFEVAEGTEPDILACYTAQLAYLAYEQGQLREYVPLLEQAVEANPGIPGFRSILALALVDAGRIVDAGQLLRIDADVDFRQLARDVTFLSVACIYARVVARTADVGAGAALYELLKPFARLIAYPGFAAWGPVDLFLGELALLRGELTAAEMHLTRAAERGRSCQAPLWEARAGLELARLALVRGDSGVADTRLAETRAIAQPRGFGCVLAELETVRPEEER